MEGFYFDSGALGFGGFFGCGVSGVRVSGLRLTSAHVYALAVLVESTGSFNEARKWRISDEAAFTAWGVADWPRNIGACIASNILKVPYAITMQEKLDPNIGFDLRSYATLFVEVDVTTDRQMGGTVADRSHGDNT